MSRARLGIALAACAATGAQAFNTGNHFVATYKGLARADFSDSAIRYVQISNYQVDYVANYPEQVAPAVLRRGVASASMRFHFDSLFEADRIDGEFAWMESAAQSVVENAARAGDIRRIITALGITLHAIQDFYSHSNMADQDWRRWADRRIVLWDELPDEVRTSPLLALKTGKTSGIHPAPPDRPPCDPRRGIAKNCWPIHGEPVSCLPGETPERCGLNHDAHTRRHALTAMQMAALATFTWSEKFRGWVGNAALWKRVRFFSGNFDVGSCWRRATEGSAAAHKYGTPRFDANGRPRAEDKSRIVKASAAYRCSMLWQDGPWADAMLALDEHYQGNRTSPAWRDRARPHPQAAVFSGTYEATFGAHKGELKIQFGPTGVGSLTLDGHARPVSAFFDGRSARVFAHDLEGRLYFIPGPKPALSGWLRNRSGVPDGFHALKK